MRNGNCGLYVALAQSCIMAVQGGLPRLGSAGVKPYANGIVFVWSLCPVHVVAMVVWALLAS